MREGFNEEKYPENMREHTSTQVWQDANRSGKTAIKCIITSFQRRKHAAEPKTEKDPDFWSRSGDIDREAT